MTWIQDIRHDRTTSDVYASVTPFGYDHIVQCPDARATIESIAIELHDLPEAPWTRGLRVFSSIRVQPVKEIER